MQVIVKNIVKRQNATKTKNEKTSKKRLVLICNSTARGWPELHKCLGIEIWEMEVIPVPRYCRT